MACNLEYILWHIETLHGFSYNYQLLYGSYVAIAAFTEALITLWMQKKHLYDQDNTDSGCQNTLNAAEDGVWGIGIFLLGLHFLAASFLHSAWQTVFLGIIQGCSAAIFTTRTTSGWWALGYGIGSLVGGIVVEDSGTHWLFWVIAISILFWSQIIIVCKG
ncbi:uncharacterized protein LOC117282994 [Cryptotermes secundus]|nr:uncharacterized protein LOC117282994 [Cryptotermes secundus]